MFSIVSYPHLHSWRPRPQYDGIGARATTWNSIENSQISPQGEKKINDSTKYKYRGSHLYIAQQWTLGLVQKRNVNLEFHQLFDRHRLELELVQILKKQNFILNCLWH